VDKRVEALIETVSETVFGYVASGLFERHKLIVASQLTMSVLRKQDKLQQGKFEWLLKGPRVLGVENPLPEWIAQPNWECVQSLREVDGLRRASRRSGGEREAVARVDGTRTARGRAHAR
jgi:dynein heavy chain